MSEFTVHDKQGRERYKVVPHGKGVTLCYEVFYRREEFTDSKGKHHETRWVSLQKYPSTIDCAIRIIADDIERNGGYKYFAKSTPAELAKTAAQIAADRDAFVVKLAKQAKDK